jgi:hypothetical protein
MRCLRLRIDCTRPSSLGRSLVRVFNARIEAQSPGEPAALFNRLVTSEALAVNVAAGVTMSRDQVARAWDARLEHAGDLREDQQQLRFGEVTPSHAVSMRDLRHGWS